MPHSGLIKYEILFHSTALIHAVSQTGTRTLCHIFLKSIALFFTQAGVLIPQHVYQIHFLDVESKNVLT